MMDTFRTTGSSTSSVTSWPVPLGDRRPGEATSALTTRKANGPPTTLAELMRRTVGATDLLSRSDTVNVRGILVGSVRSTARWQAKVAITHALESGRDRRDLVGTPSAQRFPRRRTSPVMSRIGITQSPRGCAPGDLINPGDDRRRSQIGSTQGGIPDRRTRRFPFDFGRLKG
ncbi:hypothetical protein FRAAL1548 [Frankia alni ACN14a]|uniref:Uncharacterized protein n=1 Tax=Frankia alni (strain DSM 45986 / CECT 9034 / ACN14a) TaxID=326424 RepID=Q0RQH1_FRAAA|nr:hypothetical protein FRAAL1548 [Frankia alni ACN14a]